MVTKMRKPKLYDLINKRLYFSLFTQNFVVLLCLPQTLAPFYAGWRYAEESAPRSKRIFAWH